MAKELPKTVKTEVLPPKKDNTSAISNLMAQYQTGEGAGFENVKATDLNTPFLQIVQGLSPEMKKGDQKYIEGAEVGDIFHTITRQLYKVKEPDGKPLIVIPCGFIRVWNEWKLRNLGGGFVKTHFEGKVPATHKGIGKLEKRNLVDGNDNNEIVETAMHSVIVLDPSGVRYPCVIPCVSSNLSPSRNWLNKLDSKRICDDNGRAFRPPMFANRCAASTTLKTFDDGESYIWKFDLVEDVNEDEFKEALGFHKVSQDRLALMAPALQEALPDKGQY